MNVNFNDLPEMDATSSPDFLFGVDGKLGPCRIPVNRMATMLPLAGSQSGWHRVLTKLELDLDVNIVVIGDSTANETTDWVYQFLQLFRRDWPEYNFNYKLFNNVSNVYDANVAMQTTDFTKKVDIYNCSISGYRLENFLGSYLYTGVRPVDADLVLVSLGHNDFTSATGADMVGNWLVQIAYMMSMLHPTAGVVLCAPNARNDVNAPRAIVANNHLQTIASLLGYDFVSVFNFFKQNRHLISGDGLPPTADGMRAWARIVYETVPKSALFCGPQIRTSLAGQINNLIVDGTFAGYTTGTPAGWTILGATTFGKDNTNYEARHGWSVRFIGGSSGQAGAYYALPLREVAGKWVTFAASLRVPTGNPSTSGRVGITTGVSTLNGSNSSTVALDVFKWMAVQHYIEPNASHARCHIYADSATGTAFEVQVDKAFAIVGRIPAFITS